MDEDFTMRIRDFDIVFFEGIPKGEHNLTFHIGDARLGVTYPEIEFEVQRAIAELGQMANRSRVVAHSVMAGGRRFFGQFFNLVRV